LEKQSGLKNFREEKFCALFTTGRLSAENWNTTDAQVDFYYLKGIVEGILQKLGFMDRNLSLEESKSKVFPQSLTYVLGEKVIAEVSVVSKSLLESFDIKNAVYILICSGTRY
jgi:phenylalanyl-tRNA synthetase beta chain